MDARELRDTFGPKKPRNAGLRSVSDMCVSAARRLVGGLNKDNWAFIETSLTTTIWVAVKEFKLKYHNPETIPFTVYQ